ncbi:MAG: aspartate carbamoyltransferase regulatory subunit, partial [Waddliaceae bacterium]
TVIDHISAGHGLKMVQFLQLAKHNKQVTLGLNLPSNRLEYKDIIKVEDRELTPEEANQVSVLAPDATINIIHDFEIRQKFQVSIPKTIEAVILCPNPRCISNHENVPSSLNVLQRVRNTIQLQCRYCRKIFTQAEIK